MKKPNRKDFRNDRNGRSRYLMALRRYNAYIRKNNKEAEKKRKNIGKDPRPKIGDFPNREAYRQAVLKWREKNVTPNKKTHDSRGRDLNTSLKIKKQIDKYVADRKVPINKVKPEVKKETNTKPSADAKVIKDKQNKGKTPSNKPRAKDKAKVIKDKRTLKVKKDPLADYRRGPGTKLGKDTRITKQLKKAGFTEDRLAKLRKDHADWKAKRKRKNK